MLRCGSCDLLYISPYPQSEKERFEAVANNSHRDITVIGPEEYSLARETYYQDLYPFVKPVLNGADSLLDIGCGTGHLLKLAKQEGVKHCDGLELNSARAEYARKDTGSDIAELPIEKYETDKKYDVITMIDVLSHIYSYDELFNSVKSLLKQDGKFLIKTGQFTKDVQKGSVFDWEVPDHLHFLGLGSLEYLSKKYNMSILSHEMVAHADELYTRKRFLTKGRSWKRNVIKAMIAYTPFAIKYLKNNYLKYFGRSVYSSVIVLKQKDRF